MGKWTLFKYIVPRGSCEWESWDERNGKENDPVTLCTSLITILLLSIEPLSYEGESVYSDHRYLCTESSRRLYSKQHK